jgi:hypothetical protein
MGGWPQPTTACSVAHMARNGRATERDRAASVESGAGRASEDEITLGRFVRGVPTFLSVLCIGLVVTAIVALIAASAIFAVLGLVPLPWDPPWKWFPEKIWHWAIGWLALGGLATAIGAAVARRVVGWLEWGERGPRLSRPVLWSLGAGCAAVLLVSSYELGRILMAKTGHVQSLQRKPIQPERVCMKDPSLPSPTIVRTRKGPWTTYDTNGDTAPDVALDGRPGSKPFAVVIDTAENSGWSSYGYCYSGGLHSKPPSG